MIASHQHINNIARHISPFLGGKLSANEASLLMRGLRTLPLRMKQHQQSALQLAEKLRDHPQVSAVCHPGLNPLNGPRCAVTAGCFPCRDRTGRHTAILQRPATVSHGRQLGGFESW